MRQKKIRETWNFFVIIITQRNFASLLLYRALRLKEYLSKFRLLDNSKYRFCKEEDETVY